MGRKCLPLYVVGLAFAALLLVSCNSTVTGEKQWPEVGDQPVSPPTVSISLTSEDAPWGLPAGGSPQRLLTRIAFTVGHDGKKRQPLWVAYNIKSEWVDLPSLSKRKFKPDPDLPAEESANDTDYVNSGYDRGHMAPFASIRRENDPKPEYESCYFSNICPQKPLLNRQIWRLLEERVRDWAKKYGEVWVVTGPIFGEDGKTLPSGRVAIPLSFYKIVTRVEEEKIELLSFILPQDATSAEDDKKFVKFLVSVDDVERATGLDFMSELADEIENVVEAKKPIAIWAKR